MEFTHLRSMFLSDFTHSISTQYFNVMWMEDILNKYLPFFSGYYVRAVDMNEVKDQMVNLIAIWWQFLEVSIHRVRNCQLMRIC